MKEYLQGTQPRRTELFSADWQFALTNTMELPQKTEWTSVQLPHDWSVLTSIRHENPCGGAGGFFECGIGWYRKQFCVHREKTEQISLYFEGVWKNCDIWINGQHVAHHDNGYVSFTIDVTQYLQNGENECLLRVDNSDQPNSRWYSGSGITRDAWICATQSTHLRENGVFVTTSGLAPAKVRVQLEIEGEWQGTEAYIQIEEGTDVITDGKFPFSKETLSAELMLANPVLWSVENPFLYMITVEIYAQDKLLDTQKVRFGVREILFDPAHGFLLNGVRVKLNGVCLHHDGGCVGAAVPPAVWSRRFEKLKKMGCNAIRCSHNPPDPAFLDLCDEMGFLVNAELFDEWREVKRKTYNNITTDISHGYGEVFDRCAEEDAVSAVRRDRNHPSIILWSVGNEIPEQVRPEGVDLLRCLKKLVLSQDTTRPITTANDQMHAEPSATLDAFMAETDVIGDNYIDRWRSYAELMFEPDKIKHPERIYYGSEHSSIYGWRGDYTNAGETTSWWFLAPYASRMLKAERLMKFTMTRDWVCGDFMWTGIDHLGESDWPRKSSICGVMDTAGFEKDSYYFYQSQWVKDRPVLHLFPWLNLEIPKGKIIPFVVYTNCASVELVVNGLSYGRKSYEYPTQGMSNHWEGFEHPIAEITTNDLHLSWDVPYQEGIIEAIGYDQHHREIKRVRVQTAEKPAKLEAKVDKNVVKADGRDVIQVELELKDANGVLVPNQDVEIRAEVGGTLRLLGMDNGNGECHIPFDSQVRPTCCGKLYLIAQSNGQKGEATIECTAPGIEPVRIEIFSK